MSDSQNQNVETFEYKAEMKQLLHLIVHSLYTHPEVFLLELISNAEEDPRHGWRVVLEDQAINEMQHLGWLAEEMVDGGGSLRRALLGDMLAAQAADDAIGDRQPQAGAFAAGLGGDKGLERLAPDLFGHSHAAVSPAQQQVAISSLGRDLERAPVGHGLNGVEQDV